MVSIQEDLGAKTNYRHLPSSGVVRLGLGGVPVTGCRSNDKCSNNNRPDRLFRDRRSNSALSNEQRL